RRGFEVVQFNGVPFRKDRPSRTPSLSGSTEPTAKTSWMPTSSFQSTRLNRSPINGLKNTTPIESMRHLDIKPRQPMQHKGFFRHTPSGMVLKKKGDEQLTALQTTFRRENISLAGYSSAEPASVTVQQCKIQISNLDLQPVDITSHFLYSSYNSQSAILLGPSRPTNRFDSMKCLSGKIIMSRAF